MLTFVVPQSIDLSLCHSLNTACLVTHKSVQVATCSACAGTSYIASYNPDDKISARRAIEAAGGRIIKDMAFINSWAIEFDQQDSRGTPNAMSTPQALSLVDLHESITAMEVCCGR